MKQKETFKQLTIGDFKKRVEGKNAVDNLAGKFLATVDIETDKIVVDLLHELGYTKAVEGMTIEQAEEVHSQMQADGMYLNITKEVTPEGKLVVKVFVVQTARVLTFDIEEKS